MLAILPTALLLGAAPLCGPLDLDTAIGLAAARNDEIGAKQAEAIAAHADESLARAARVVPNANLTFLVGPAPEAHGDVTHAIGGATNRKLDGLRPFIRVEAELLQPLYTWGRLDAARDAAAAGSRAKQELVQDTASQVQLRITRLFWGVALAKKLLGVANEVRSALDDADKRVSKALAKGDTDISPADKYRLDIFRSMVAGRIADAQKGLDLARVGLAASLALPSARLVLKEVALEPGAATVPDMATALAAAETQRPDLRALGEGIRAREASVRAEKAAFLPQFFLAGHFSYSRAWNRDIQLNPWVSDYFNELTVGGVLGFRQDFKMPTLSANAEKAMAERATLERQRVGLTRLVEVQVETALVEIRADETRHTATKGALTSARSLFRSSGLDFAAGLLDTKSLIEAYLAYVEAQVNAAQAAYDLLVARAQLAQVVGEQPRKGIECELP